MQIGGTETCRRLAVAFYARVMKDPVLRPIYPKSLHCTLDALARYFVQQFGGPCTYSEGRHWLSLYEAHLRFAIGPRERDAWLRNMIAALDDVGIGEPARSELERYFSETATYLINRPEPARAAGVLAPDDAVAALRRGDLERVAEFAAHPEFQRDRAAWVSLLAMMIGSQDPRMVDFAVAWISANPAWVHERFTYGKTLLHAAAAEGCLPMVELLLRLGADPDARDRFGHPPLYSVGNSCLRDTGGAVVHALVRAGAQVNAQDRVKRCTPLHMAARRGNVQVAKALLECGADPAICDIAGVDALQRAINCRKPQVAALLSASS